MFRKPSNTFDTLSMSLFSKRSFTVHNFDALGEFSFDGMGNDVYYLQNGFYRFNGMWKQRGLGKLGSKEIEHLETYEKDGKLFYKF